MAYGKSSGGMGSQYGRGNRLAAALAPDAAAISNIKGNTQGLAYALEKGLQGLFAGMDAKEQKMFQTGFAEAMRPDPKIVIESGENYDPEIEDQNKYNLDIDENNPDDLAPADKTGEPMPAYASAFAPKMIKPVMGADPNGRDLSTRLTDFLSSPAMKNNRYAGDMAMPMAMQQMAREQAARTAATQRGYKQEDARQANQWTQQAAQKLAESQAEKARITANKGTTIQRDYAEAKAQGYTGTIMQYQMDLNMSGSGYVRNAQPQPLGQVPPGQLNSTPMQTAAPTNQQPTILPYTPPTAGGYTAAEGGPAALDKRRVLASEERNRIAAEKATPQYKARVQRELLAAKPIPAAIQKEIEANVDYSKSTEGINADLMAFSEMIDKGTLDLGLFQNMLSKGRQFTGNSNEVSRNYGSFMTNLERLRNESLRLNKGIQTEGDAARIWNEIIANPTDEKFVQQRIRELVALNQRNIRNADSATTRYRAEYGRDAMEGRKPASAVFKGSVPDTTLPTPDANGFSIKRIR